MNRISMTIGALKVTAEIFDTDTARAIWEALPIRATAQTWGEEVYFTTPVVAAQEPDARQVVDPGELAFWLAGHAIAICFGPTPASHGQECRLISDANIWGRLDGDPRALAAVADGDSAVVEMSSADDV